MEPMPAGLQAPVSPGKFWVSMGLAVCVLIGVYALRPKLAIAVLKVFVLLTAAAAFMKYTKE